MNAQENVKEFGRKLGKISHANPLTVFNTLLSQIEVYNNMIIPVVDALKYITPLGYDALTYCVVLFLGGALAVGVRPRTRLSYRTLHQRLACMCTRTVLVQVGADADLCG